MDERIRQATRCWTLAQPVVSAFVASVVCDFRDRDDVLQETALAVFDAFDKYDTSRPFNAWALGIARNQVGLYIRKRRRDRLVFDDNVMISLATAFSEISSEESHRFASSNWKVEPKVFATYVISMISSHQKLLSGWE